MIRRTTRPELTAYARLKQEELQDELRQVASQQDPVREKSLRRLLLGKSPVGEYRRSTERKLRAWGDAVSTTLGFYHDEKCDVEDHGHMPVRTALRYVARLGSRTHTELTAEGDSIKQKVLDHRHAISMMERIEDAHVAMKPATRRLLRAVLIDMLSSEPQEKKAAALRVSRREFIRRRDEGLTKLVQLLDQVRRPERPRMYVGIDDGARGAPEAQKTAPRPTRGQVRYSMERAYRRVLGQGNAVRTHLAPKDDDK